MRFKIIILFCILLLITGCTAKKALRRADDRVITRYGDFELVRLNNDLYMQKPDGTHQIRMTNTPHLKEGHAFLLSNTGYLVYSVVENPRKPERYYILNIDQGAGSRQRITEKEFNRYLLDR
jgi:hypothetical protein